MMRCFKSILGRQRRRKPNPPSTEVQSTPAARPGQINKDEGQKQEEGSLASTPTATVNPIPVDKATQRRAQIHKGEGKKQQDGGLSPPVDSIPVDEPTQEQEQTQKNENQKQQGASAASTPTEEFTPFQNRDERGHWEIAYDELSEDDRRTLQPPTTDMRPEDGALKVKESLREVVQTTKDQYEDYKKGGILKRSGHKDIDIRAVTQKILDSVLSFRDVIKSILSFDPSGHAAGAWGIVSLGLTMAKNHIDRREALFKSASFLADILARYAFIEENLYRTGGKIRESQAAIVRVYTAILRYVAEVHRVQQSGAGGSFLASVTAITDQPLVTLQSSVTEEDLHFKSWLLIEEHLHRKEEAEDILAGIDKIMMAIQESITEGALSKLPVAKDAFHNSYASQHEDECLAGTRTALLQKVMEWGGTPKDKSIFWLSGMAGTGKSTIARTVARSFKENCILGASFFFKRGDGDRGSAAKLLPTIMRELAVHIPQLIPGIERAIKDDPNIASRSLQEQFNKLLIQPLRNIKEYPARTTVIVIDALDECESEKDMEMVLDLLPQVQKSASLHLRFFLTSRPEIHINRGFNNIDRVDFRDIILHDVDQNVIKHDISIFLKAEFLKIGQKARLPPSWPGDAKVGMITDMATPLFIFAATVCRFVANSKLSPDIQLETLLEDPALASTSRMERTYQPILNQVLTGEDERETKQLLEEFQMIVGVIIVLADPLSVDALAKLLDIRVATIAYRLEYFHSVLNIPKNRKLPIRTLHLSFRDYLVDKRKQENEHTARFWVNEKEKHGVVMTRCLSVMDNSLKKNICKLPSPGTYRADISPDIIKQCLPPSLEYSCRYWAYHLTRCQNPLDALHAVVAFLKKHFLHWLESMSILGCLLEAVDIVTMLHSLAKGVTDILVLEFIADANQFVSKNLHMVDTAPLQLYSSGLAFAPQNAIIKDIFRTHIPLWICKPPNVEERWSLELLTLEGHCSFVTWVEFSPDGTLLASGSSEGEIKVWDTSGALRYTLKGHTGEVKRIAFSPDGKLIASGSTDETIKLWDTHTGALEHTMEGWSYIEHLLFSPTGQLIASSGQSGSINLWDTTGSLRHTLGAPQGPTCVVFSLDGSLLATGYSDGTFKLWSITGALLLTLSGLGRIVSVDLSYGIIASGEQRGIVNLWDTTGTLLHTLEDQYGWLRYLVFSPDGTLLATASGDGVVRLWHAENGTLKHTLYRGESAVESITFSPNGKRLLVGFSVNPATLWDVTSGELVCVLEGHLSAVRRFIFSADGRLIASGSNDTTIKLWYANIPTIPGARMIDTAWNSRSVAKLTVSPNGKYVASGSHGGPVRLWAADTGDLQHEITPEKHSSPVGRTILFSPDSTLVLLETHESSRLYDTTTGALKLSLDRGAAGRTRTGKPRFSPDSKLVAYLSYTDAEIWDLATGVLRCTVKGTHMDSLSLKRQISFSPDSTLVATYFVECFRMTGERKRTKYSHGEAIELLNARTGEVQNILEEHSTWTIEFSADGKLVASGSTGGSMKLWKATTGGLQHLLEGHSDRVKCLKFSPDNQILISCSSDGTLKTWDTALGTLRHSLQVPEIVTGLTLSRNGTDLNAPIELIDAEASYKEGRCIFYKGVMFVHDQWIYLEGERLFWIPHEYRVSSAVHENCVFLGSVSGKVAFMEFCPQLLYTEVASAV